MNSMNGMAVREGNGAGTRGVINVAARVDILTFLGEKLDLPGRLFRLIGPVRTGSSQPVGDENTPVTADTPQGETAAASPQEAVGICPGGGNMDIATDGRWEGTLEQLLDSWSIVPQSGPETGRVVVPIHFGFGAACIFADSAARFGCQLSLTANGMTVDGNSVMAILSLGIGPGQAVMIEAVGTGAPEAVRTLVALVDNSFGIVQRVGSQGAGGKPA